MNATVTHGAHDAHGASAPVATPPEPKAAPAGPTAAAPEAAAQAVQSPAAPPSPLQRHRKWIIGAGIVFALILVGRYGVPWVHTMLNTVSTDDAYVNGHVTYVAPRVSGQVARVLVDDNMRVKKGDVLVQLDKEPYEVQVALKRAAVAVAEANVVAAEANARALTALLGSQRWKLQTAMEQVDAQVAQLAVKVANLQTQEAILVKAQADY